MKGPISPYKLNQFKELADEAIQNLKSSDESSMYGLSLIMAKNYFVKRINHQSSNGLLRKSIIMSYHRISHEMRERGISPILRNWIWYIIRDLVRDKPATQSTLLEIVDKISVILNEEKVSPFLLEEVEEFY